MSFPEQKTPRFTNQGFLGLAHYSNVEIELVLKGRVLLKVRRIATP